MQNIRRKNMRELVPQEIGKRNDFVHSVEMIDACNQIGDTLGVDLQEFSQYYTIKIAKRKFIPLM